MFRNVRKNKVKVQNSKDELKKSSESLEKIWKIKKGSGKIRSSIKVEQDRPLTYILTFQSRTANIHRIHT